MIKRGVDVLGASLLLLLASPLLLLAAFFISAGSPGPVFFRQLRIGRGAKPFEIWKLRTMAFAESGLAYTFGADPRITPLGKWLRRTKIDELPQLWNVLRGEMSLVGPRPVIPELVLEFNTGYSRLLEVRPGLTDPASLKYSQESRTLAAASDPMDFFKTVVTPDKIRISAAYMERANLWSDLAILAMTGFVCCVPALSRVYGAVPKPLPREIAEPFPETVSRPIWEPMRHLDSVPHGMGLVAKPRLGRVSPPKTESLFVPDSVYAASSVDEMPPMGIRPWILLQMPDPASRSASMGARGSGSRL